MSRKQNKKKKQNPEQKQSLIEENTIDREAITEDNLTTENIVSTTEKELEISAQNYEISDNVKAVVIKNGEFFRNEYKYSLEETNRIAVKIADQRTLLMLIIGGALAFLANKLPRFYEIYSKIDANLTILWFIPAYWVLTAFFMAFAFSFIMLIWAMVNILRAVRTVEKKKRIPKIVAYHTATMSTPREVFQAIIGFEKCNKFKEYEGEKLTKSMDDDINYLINTVCIDTATKNRENNKKRFEYLSDASFYNILAGVGLFLTLILYFIIKFYKLGGLS